MAPRVRANGGLHPPRNRPHNYDRRLVELGEELRDRGRQSWDQAVRPLRMGTPTPLRRRAYLLQRLSPHNLFALQSDRLVRRVVRTGHTVLGGGRPSLPRPRIPNLHEGCSLQLLPKTLLNPAVTWSGTGSGDAIYRTSSCRALPFARINEVSRTPGLRVFLADIPARISAFSTIRKCLTQDSGFTKLISIRGNALSGMTAELFRGSSSVSAL